MPRIAICVLLLFSAGTPFKSEAASWFSRAKGRIAEAAEKAKDACQEGLEIAGQKAGEALSGAAEGVAAIQRSFTTFLQSIDLEGIGNGAAGGAAGIKALFWDNFKVMDTAKMAWRIWRFEPDVDGLRDGIFNPLTNMVGRLCEVNQACATLPAEERIKQQVVAYGELISLIFEVTLKTYKMIPQIVLEVVPTGFGSIFAFVQEKPPESVDQLAVMVMRQFLKNAFKAITTKGLSLDQRFALLNVDMATIEASGDFAQRAGIVDFLAALKNYRDQNPPPPPGDPLLLE